MDPALDGITAAVVLEGPVREAVHRMKYGDRPQLGARLARLWEGLPEPWRDTVLVPVPLDRRRQRKRGYNQAAVLAQGLSRLTGLRTLEGLSRIVATGTQVGRSGDERRQALEGGFAWKLGDAPPVVVVVDDVVTTGATLIECGRACRRAGAISVHGLALAVG